MLTVRQVGWAIGYRDGLVWRVSTDGQAEVATVQFWGIRPEVLKIAPARLRILDALSSAALPGNGVGQAKLEKYGATFLEVIALHMRGAPA